ncbi:hypothetical protein PKF032_04560 [Polynucleobacter yangtzensis]|uniref:Uncharacterized protein n=1 Tax=Polynucleobacter yangtzensis TaxID=1743159 RepID=A0ABN6TRA5_9BURK|nr:hypothetical protein PKF032_04560 [Polynucleobacter yangtzensis]
MIALSITEISHLCYMSIPYHPTKTRQIRIIHENDSTVITAPNKLPLFGLEFVFTEYAISHGKNVNENGI